VNEEQQQTSDAELISEHHPHGIKTKKVGGQIYYYDTRDTKTDGDK